MCRDSLSTRDASSIYGPHNRSGKMKRVFRPGEPDKIQTTTPILTIVHNTHDTNRNRFPQNALHIPTNAPPTTQARMVPPRATTIPAGNPRNQDGCGNETDRPDGSDDRFLPANYWPIRCPAETAAATRRTRTRDHSSHGGSRLAMPLAKVASWQRPGQATGFDRPVRDPHHEQPSIPHAVASDPRTNPRPVRLPATTELIPTTHRLSERHDQTASTPASRPRPTTRSHRRTDPIRWQSPARVRSSPARRRRQPECETDVAACRAVPIRHRHRPAATSVSLHPVVRCSSTIPITAKPDSATGTGLDAVIPSNARNLKPARSPILT